MNPACVLGEATGAQARGPGMRGREPAESHSQGWRWGGRLAGTLALAAGCVKPPTAGQARCDHGRKGDARDGRKWEAQGRGKNTGKQSELQSPREATQEQSVSSCERAVSLFGDAPGETRGRCVRRTDRTLRHALSPPAWSDRSRPLTVAPAQPIPSPGETHSRQGGIRWGVVPRAPLPPLEFQRD